MKVRGKTVYSRNPAFVIRDAEMVLMFRDGKTLQEIGSKYGVTREYVRQQLAKLGLGRLDGGACFRAFSKASEVAARNRAKSEAREQRHFSRWGITRAEMDAISDSLGLTRSDVKHPAVKFVCQRKSAKGRGIAWQMTFGEWWKVWLDSGHWSERGRGYGYVMARWADDGPYSVENVYICTQAQNSSDSYITKPAAGRAVKARVTRERNRISLPPVSSFSEGSSAS